MIKETESQDLKRRLTAGLLQVIYLDIKNLFTQNNKLLLTRTDWTWNSGKQGEISVLLSRMSPIFLSLCVEFPIFCNVSLYYFHQNVLQYERNSQTSERSLDRRDFPSTKFHIIFYDLGSLFRKNTHVCRWFSSRPWDRDCQLCTWSVWSRFRLLTSDESE